jgi:hypothetical protein
VSAALCSYFVQKGFVHVLPASMLRWSQQKWSQGLYSESVRWFVLAGEGAFDAGVRWSIAELYVGRTRRFFDEGQLGEARENCAQAVRILGDNDDEGAVSYLCTAIEERIRAQE